MGKGRPSGYERDELVAAVADRDGWFCRWCGCRLDSASVTLDHLVPFGGGNNGTNDPENLVFACYSCNQRRGSMDAVEWQRIAVFHLMRVNDYWRGEPESAAPVKPITPWAAEKVGTLVSRASVDAVELELGGRVAACDVLENGTTLDHRLSHLHKRAFRAVKISP